MGKEMKRKEYSFWDFSYGRNWRDVYANKLHKNIDFWVAFLINPIVWFAVGNILVIWFVGIITALGILFGWLTSRTYISLGLIMGVVFIILSLYLLGGLFPFLFM